MDLPRPDVTVGTSESGSTKRVEVTISRDGKARGYQGEAATHGEATRRVVEKILADPHTAEWLPSR
jgi:hypothetical protein